MLILSVFILLCE